MLHCLRCLTALSAVLLLLSGTPLHAQAVYGSIVGTVTDSSGAAVPNAKITITDIGRDVTASTVANESGNFTQRYLIVGRYRVRVEAPGFKAFVQDNANVSVDTEVRLDVRLEVGEVNQTVEVSAEVGILKTERSDVATTYIDRIITNLPILNRRFTNFQLMTPGVVSFPTSLTAASAENPQGSYRMLVNGQSFAGTSHLLDGTDNHDAVLGWIVINPTLESVTEAKITTANYDAEFGVASAGVVSAQTKSGTNQIAWHGLRVPAQRSSAGAQSVHAVEADSELRRPPGAADAMEPVRRLEWRRDHQEQAVLLRRLSGNAPQHGRRHAAARSFGRRAHRRSERDRLSRSSIRVRSAGQSHAVSRRRHPRQPVCRRRPQNLLKLIPMPNIAAALDQPNFAASGGVKIQ